MKVEFRILDARLREWGFPKWGSDWAAGLDVHACLDAPLDIHPQSAPVLISTGMAFRIGDLNWCALVLPRSGLGHHQGLVLGNFVGLVDPDFDGVCEISVWNRNSPAYATGASPSTISIRPGDRIAQLVFTRVTRPQVAIVEKFSAGSARGSGGYGSTGV